MAEALFITEFSAVTNPVQLRWYLQSNPIALVGDYDLPFPNVDGEETVITGLSSKLYRFEFWEMVSGSPVSQVGKSIYLKPKGNKVAVELLHYLVGGANDWDPVAGSDTLTDDRLNGKTFHVSQRVNDWRAPSDYAAVTGGGFQLLTGEVFEDGDQWTVMVISTIDTEEVSVTDYQEVKIVSTSEDFDDTYKLKNNIGSGSNDLITTFPAFSLIADTRAKFSTYSFSGNYWTLQFSSGDTVMFLGQAVNSIALRQDEIIEILWDGGVGHVIGYNGKAELAGEFVLADKQLRGTLFADGAEYDIADFEDLIDRLPTAKKVSYSQWNETATKWGKTYYKNRGKFAIDTTGGKFKVPDIRDFGLRSLKNNDGTTDSYMLSQGVGGMWGQDVVLHNHELQTTASSMSGNSGADPVRGTIGGAPVTRGGVGVNKSILQIGDRSMTDSIAQIALVRI